MRPREPRPRLRHPFAPIYHDRMRSVPINRIALYVRDLRKMADFYARHFGFIALPTDQTDKLTLAPADGGAGLRLVLLQASKGHRLGQSCVKLIFDVDDVARAKTEQAALGLKFGAIHRGPGYEFANARDPARNLIQISTGHRTDAETSHSAPPSAASGNAPAKR